MHEPGALELREAAAERVPAIAPHVRDRLVGARNEECRQVLLARRKEAIARLQRAPCRLQRFVDEAAAVAQVDAGARSFQGLGAKSPRRESPKRARRLVLEKARAADCRGGGRGERILRDLDSARVADRVA